MPANSFIVDFIAGWTAGGAGLLIGHPMDTIKVRLQALKGYTGAIQCIKQTFRQESIGGFYKGMLFPFLSTGLIHSVYFGGYGIMLKLFQDPKNGKTNFDETPFGYVLGASIIGSALQWIPACPIEIVKTKLQVQKAPTFHVWSKLTQVVPNYDQKIQSHTNGNALFTSPWDCLKQTLRQEGITGLYRGGLIMLIRDVGGFCFYMPVYEYIKYFLQMLSSTKDTSQLSISHQDRLITSIVAGGTAGVMSWLTILPLDLIKSRLQADDIYQPKYKGILHCAKESFRHEGLTGFYKGWHVVALRAFPTNAVLFLCYDEMLRLLNQHKFLG